MSLGSRAQIQDRCPPASSRRDIALASLFLQTRPSLGSLSSRDLSESGARGLITPMTARLLSTTLDLRFPFVRADDPDHHAGDHRISGTRGAEGRCRAPEWCRRRRGLATHALHTHPLSAPARAHRDGEGWRDRSGEEYAVPSTAFKLVRTLACPVRTRKPQARSTRCCPTNKI
ncbi:hypothetical protein PsYK624_097820 [Phanerochaete sordida]|uniref:Uncharacterized protein n=1 Tax=Phanerochaete sordida TaxID=48140 RepID=A0A9P3GDD0_9APHY|nr:hypothetical protein PsYK624_097820 [Phanerochaete sordida]